MLINDISPCIGSRPHFLEYPMFGVLKLIFINKQQVVRLFGFVIKFQLAERKFPLDFLLFQCLNSALLRTLQSSVPRFIEMYLCLAIFMGIFKNKSNQIVAGSE